MTSRRESSCLNLSWQLTGSGRTQQVGLKSGDRKYCSDGSKIGGRKPWLPFVGLLLSLILLPLNVYFWSSSLLPLHAIQPIHLLIGRALRAMVVPVREGSREDQLCQDRRPQENAMNACIAVLWPAAISFLFRFFSPWFAACLRYSWSSSCLMGWSLPINMRNIRSATTLRAGKGGFGVWNATSPTGQDGSAEGRREKASRSCFDLDLFPVRRSLSLQFPLG